MASTPGLSVCFHPGMVISDPALDQIPNGGYYSEESSCQMACQQRGSTCTMWTWKQVGDPYKAVLPGGCWLIGEGAKLRNLSLSGDTGRVVSGPQYCPTLAPWPPANTSAPAAPAITTLAPAGVATLAPSATTLAPSATTLAPSATEVTSFVPVTAPPLIVTTPGVALNGTAAMVFNGTEAVANGTNTTNATVPGETMGGGGFPWWAIVAAIAGAALLIGLAMYLCGGEGKKATKKKKKTKRSAEARLEDGQEAQPLVESQPAEPLVGQPSASQVPQQSALLTVGQPPAAQVPQPPTPQPPISVMPQQAVPTMSVGPYQASYTQPPLYTFGPAAARQPQFVVR